MSKTMIYVFPKNDREEIRINATEFKGKMYLDLRVFYPDLNSKEMRPSKKGITLSTELIPELKKAILHAEKVLGGKEKITKSFELSDQKG